MPSMSFVPARLGELARAFTWLGLTAFGGPAAHLAIMQREFVERRGWLSRERFVDLLGLSSLLPGPTSTEMALGIGFERARWSGLLIAGLGFILPATLLVLGLAILYVEVGAVAGVHDLLYGMTPVVLAVIAHAVIKLVPTAFTDAWTWLIGLAALGASVLAALAPSPLLQPVVVLLGGALAGLAVRRLPLLLRGASGAAVALHLPGASVVVPAAAAGLGLGAIFLTFLKMGLVVFGSGYVLVAFLGSELVDPGLHQPAGAARCHRHRAADPWTRLHERHLHRLSPRGCARGDRGDRRHLPAGLRAGRCVAPVPAPPACECHGLGGPRRPQRGRRGAHRRIGRHPCP